MKDDGRRTNGAGSQHDFIIVGSGAGGGPLAANLALAGYRVLLLEAGDDCGESYNYQIPAFSCQASEDAAMRWDYFVRHYADEEQQKRDTKLVADRDGIFYPRAGTLGGCTAHNAMITIYPHNSDWDGIAELTGDASWNHSNMRSYWQRLENCNYLPVRRFLSWLGWNPGRRGFKGWLHTNVGNPMMALRDGELLASIARSARGAIEEMGTLGGVMKTALGLLDPNDWRLAFRLKQGLRFTPLAIRRGRRHGPREFLRETEAKCPDKLTIRTGTLVTRILFDETNRATGVEFVDARHVYKADPAASAEDPDLPRQSVYAKREVIISAGAFNTPQLLKLSGIGPAEELKRFGIPVRVDLPGVGENLQDRYEVTVVLRMKRDFTILQGATMKGPEPGEPGDTYFQQWLKGKGPYAANGGAVCIAKKSSKSDVDPDLFIFSGAGNFRGYKPGYSDDLLRTHNYLTWAVLKAHTSNRGGRVTLKSASPFDVPDINFHYFNEGTGSPDDDLEAVVDGVEFARGLAKPLGALLDAEEVPGPSVDTREEIKEFVRNEAWGHHASCSCRIGPDGDPMAVVDSRFRVRGTTGLRIVDASVFPRIPGFFIVTAIYMISEKAADAILDDAASDSDEKPRQVRTSA